MWARCSLVAAALFACDRPQVLVICHNGNCVEPTEPEADDTLPALEASLALEHAGLPALDGFEIDALWRRETQACVFAHDLDVERITPMSDAAAVLAAYVDRDGPLTYAGEPLQLFVELKSYVTEDFEAHTPDERVLHAECAWQTYATIAAMAAARDRERDIEVIFAAFDASLLRAVVAATPAQTPLRVRYDAFYRLPLETYAGVPIEIVEMHPQWLHDAVYEGIVSSNLELVFWMDSVTTETLDAIELYRPRMVNTSEARLIRRWLEY